MNDPFGTAYTERFEARERRALEDGCERCVACDAIFDPREADAAIDAGINEGWERWDDDRCAECQDWSVAYYIEHPRYAGERGNHGSAEAGSDAGTEGAADALPPAA